MKLTLPLLLPKAARYKLHRQNEERSLARVFSARDDDPCRIVIFMMRHDSLMFF
jgi:hypothetical protein